MCREQIFEKENNTIFMLKNTILSISCMNNIFYLFFKNLSQNSEYIEIFRLFFFCVKAHRITIKPRKKNLSLILFIILQFTFEKRSVLGLARVAYPLKTPTV